MSTSTVAVTSNPPPTTNNNNSPVSTVLALGAAATRRRNALISEKKTTSNVEMVSSDGTASGGVADLQIKKSSLLASTTIVSPRQPPRRKTAASVVAKTTNGEKPRWITVVSVLTKNFVLLIVLLGLVQLMSRLVSNNNQDTTTSVLPLGRVSEIESRIGEIDSLVKKTTKMVQVQFDVFDKKIENEIGGVRTDLMKKIEEKGEVFEKGFKKLEEKTDGLHKSLSELASYKFLTKEDLERFSEELKNSRGGVGGGSDDKPVSLNEINAVAREIVLKEIEKHEADGLGRVDYALATAGAMVVAHSESLFPIAAKWLKSLKVNDIAQKMLQPSFGEPGQCFPLKGSNGFVEIRLRTHIILEAITLEHVAKSVAYDRSSAPKECRVSGWFQARDADPSNLPEKKVLLAEFTYDLERTNAQTFSVDSTNAGHINMLRLDFNSNHGGAHTCIYRLRVHGHEPDTVAV